MNPSSAVAQQEVPLESPLSGVSPEQWTRFVRVMMTATPTSVSPSNALGAFEMTPRRLQDLGVLTELKRTRSQKSNRVIWAASKFVDHDHAKSFLRSLPKQMSIFVQSMQDYSSKIAAGAVQLPSGMTLSGALACCHRAGFAGLSAARFPATQELFLKANGIF